MSSVDGQLMEILLDSNLERRESDLVFYLSRRDKKYLIKDWFVRSDTLIGKMMDLDFTHWALLGVVDNYLDTQVDLSKGYHTPEAQILLRKLFSATAGLEDLYRLGVPMRNGFSLRILKTTDPVGYLKLLIELVPAIINYRGLAQEIMTRLAFIDFPIWEQGYDRSPKINFLRRKGFLSLDARERYYQILDILVEKYGLVIFRDLRRDHLHSELEIASSRRSYFVHLVREYPDLYDSVLETIFMNPAEYEAGTREEFAAELRSEELLDAKETLTSIEQKEEGNSRSSLPRVVASVLVDETEKQLRR